MLVAEHYADQVVLWPPSGRHIVAQFDTEGIIVYQAYRPSIAAYAVKYGHFGGEFGYSRMSWIKPGFLWMMYRSGWATKLGQEVTLAIRIRRAFFDELLAQAVPSSFEGGQYASHEEWRLAVRKSCVRLQWDPDHHPSGASLPRRALQLGLRGKTLEDYGKNQIIGIEDISSFVAEQRERASRERLDELLLPVERVYTPDDTAAMVKLGIEDRR